MTPPRASLRARLLAEAQAEVESPAPYLTGDMKFYVHDAELRDLLREAADALPAPMDADGKLRALEDGLAAEIRRVDGNHSLGAAALAEALMPFMQAALSPVAGPVTDEMVELALDAWYGAEDRGPHNAEWQKNQMRAALLAALESKDEK